MIVVRTRCVMGLTIAVCAAALLTGDVRAHELGTSGVVVSLETDRSLRVDLSVSLEDLRRRLDVLSGVDGQRVVSGSTGDPWHPALMTTLLSRIEARADGASVRLKFVGTVPGGRTPGASGKEREIVRLVGVAPPGATTFTWTSRLFLGSYPLSVRAPDSSRATQWLMPGQSSESIAWSGRAPDPSASASGTSYFAHGFTHILPGGLDHVLFVLALFFLGSGFRSLMLQVTAFTIAHSLTLALALLEVVALPASVVEPVIAGSIAFVALENLTSTDLRRSRLAIVFGFGLLHGLGFAQVLADVELEPSSLVAALVTFNLGVEAGQLAVILLAAMLVSAVRSVVDVGQRTLSCGVSGVIAVVGLYWTWDRLMTL